MDITDFFEKKDKYKLYILMFLESDAKGFFPIDTICRNLDLSKFVVDNMIQEINADLLHLGYSFTIEEENGKFIRCTKLTELIFSHIRLYYIKKSKTFQFFRELMISDMTIYEFSEKYFVSESKAYSIQKELSLIIKEYQLTINSGSLVGKEKNIRILYFEIFYHFFKGLDFFLADETTTDRLYEKVVNHFQLHCSMTQKIKLKAFLSILTSRIQRENYVPAIKVKKKSEWANFTTALKTIYTTIFSLSDAQLEGELQYLYTFLYSEQYIEIDYTSFMNTDYKVTTHLTKKFLFYLDKTIHDTPNSSAAVSQKVKAKLKPELARIHFKLSNFNIVQNSFTSKEQIDYFTEVYPEYVTVITNFLDKEEPILSKLLGYNRTALFYDYIFMLATIIPIGEISQPIKVCIDFSRGATYSNYIANNVLIFESINIMIQTVLDQTTDLFISDFAINDLACPQIIWKNPPTIRDWINFGNEVVQIREKHINEEKQTE